MGALESVNAKQLDYALIKEDVRSAIRALLRADPHAQVFKRDGNVLIISGIAIKQSETQSEYEGKCSEVCCLNTPRSCRCEPTAAHFPQTFAGTIGKSAQGQ